MSGKARYTHGHEPAVVAVHAARRAADCAAYLLPHLAPGLSVLDVGCGPGSITRDFAELVAPGTVTGVDSSSEVLAAASTTAAEHGVTNVRFQEGDAYALPFPDNSFDVVHAHMVLQHLQDPVAALREMARVCKNGGVIAVRDSDYLGFQWYPENAGIQKWLTTYVAIARGNGAEPAAGRRLRKWAQNAGLSNFTVGGSLETYASPGTTVPLAESWSARICGPTFVNQAAEIGVGDADIREMADGWHAWAAEPDAWHGRTHIELLARVHKP